ncbi:MAG TPA: GH1 family beta-glucosidase [Fimbriimonadaceae bacterium]|jgi:beta-glucosidase
MGFSKSFTWGVATASYQIEGAANEDGRGQSVWDMMCRKPGAVFEGNTGDEACDHYHRYPEDIALMRKLGVQGYRFSLAWPRIFPDGIGPINAKGLDFYDRLVDDLIKADITPWATLFHWDFPLALYHRGGWMNPDSPKWFADYTAAVVNRLSDRVSHWMTLNEQQCFIGLGLQSGIHAPGDKLAFAEVLLAHHHALLAHGHSVRVIRDLAKTTPMVGMAPACQVCIPSTESKTDVEAARAATFSVSQKNLWQMAWNLDPIFLGHYPQDGLDLFGQDVPKYTAEEMKIISTPLDFFGMNMYHGRRVETDKSGEAVTAKTEEGRPITAIKWPVTPECLYWGPKFYYERYGKEIVVTENGLSNQDWVSLDGKVHDPQRIDFLQRHLTELQRVANTGIPVGGYFQWSLMDNFEWAEGYKERFGLVHIDYVTQKRTPKDSFYWYKDVIESNGANIDPTGDWGEPLIAAAN